MGTGIEGHVIQVVCSCIRKAAWIITIPIMILEGDAIYLVRDHHIHGGHAVCQQEDKALCTVHKLNTIIIGVITHVRIGDNVVRIVQTCCHIFLCKILHGHIIGLGQWGPGIASGVLQIRDQGFHVGADGAGYSASTFATSCAVIKEHVPPSGLVPYLLQDARYVAVNKAGGLIRVGIHVLVHPDDIDARIHIEVASVHEVAEVSRTVEGRHIVRVRVSLHEVITSESGGFTDIGLIP